MELVPDRLRFLFDYSPQRALADDALRQEATAALPVVRALAEELGQRSPMVDREAFRAVAARVRERTGQKGRALFHPLRVALTGEAEGLELDAAVPAIERGAHLTQGASALRAILGARARADAFLAELSR
jgi:hypothetical protein